jgi:transposase
LGAFENSAARREWRQQRIRILGPQSETLSNLQLELLADEEPRATSDEVAAEAKREPIQCKPARERKPHAGREPLPESLPRVEKVIACTEQACRTCNKETAVIGHDISEQLDVEPARYLVRVIKREKRLSRLRAGHGDDRAIGAADLRERAGQRSCGD